MSLGPLGGIPSSAAGSPLSQTKGSDAERVQQDTGNQQRRIQTDQKAESAAGIGEADGEDHETAERDADGRRLWEPPPQAENADESQAENADESQAENADESQAASPPGQPRRSKDTTGQSGNLLDLTG